MAAVAVAAAAAACTDSGAGQTLHLYFVSTSGASPPSSCPRPELLLATRPVVPTKAKPRAPSAAVHTDRQLRRLMSCNSGRTVTPGAMLGCVREQGLPRLAEVLGLKGVVRYKLRNDASWAAPTHWNLCLPARRRRQPT